MPAKKKLGRPAAKGPTRVLRAIGAGATTPREAAAKARVKPTSAAVYIYRFRKAKLVVGKSGAMRLTAKGRVEAR
ncbi:MAG: hypothetical protein QOE90_1503 [Thermoplasmata archaeon]|jgi:hypothetical protein|nr:hypothetical protein [Thermoplasmata archaeon]